MKVLIGCERSGVVREAFRKLGHDAYSCDILPSDDNSEYHIQDDLMNHLDNNWDMAIFHPECTFLTVTGNKWFKPEYESRFPTRKQDRLNAIDFFMKLACVNIPKIAIENPIGIMSSLWRKPDQIIQPYQFGHKEAKKTCLWLKNLPKLISTKIVEPEYTVFKSGKRMATWYCNAVNLPKEERMKVRSTTFQGIADAMAEQWGTPITKIIKCNGEI